MAITTYTSTLRQVLPNRLIVAYFRLPLPTSQRHACLAPQARMSARGRAMHGRIVPIALAYEERLYEALGPAETRRFDALTGRLLSHAKRLRQAG